MPYKTTVHRFDADLMQPWLVGYRRPLFWNEWWHVVDIDNAKRRATVTRPRARKIARHSGVSLCEPPP